MSIAVDAILMERIKPSSPTPNHLRIFKFCLLDHLIPAAYAPIILFYPNRHHDSSTPLETHERVDVLKVSLSRVLTRFSPLAGTVSDDGSIVCDDEGALFVTAKVGCRLSEFLGDPDLKALEKFLPCGLNGEGRGETEIRVANIQATVFACGGISIGLCISHRILDGTALSTFLKAWADAAAGDSFESPDFSASSIFPTDGSWLKDSSMGMWGSLFKQGAFLTKRFVFDGPAIEALRERATISGNVNTIIPTRVATVSGFIWKHAMDASEKALGFKKPSMVTHVVNLRERAAPKFPTQSLGNLVWIAPAQCEPEDSNTELPALTNRITESLSNIDWKYVEKLRGEHGNKEVIQKHLAGIGEFARGGGDVLGFTSWCRLGFYVDFGWGEPVWVSSIDASGPYFMNLVVLVDTRVGNGIEAWITLDEQVMSGLEANHEFRSFATLNPSPL